MEQLLDGLISTAKQQDDEHQGAINTVQDETSLTKTPWL
jgi:hypothetical protein